MSTEMAGSDSAEMPDEDQPELSDLYAELEELEGMVDSPEAREQVRETMRMAVDVSTPDLFGRVIRGYGRADIAESLLGALLFAIPMFVEGGTNEVGRSSPRARCICSGHTRSASSSTSFTLRTFRTFGSIGHSSELFPADSSA